MAEFGSGLDFTGTSGDQTPDSGQDAPPAASGTPAAPAAAPAAGPSFGSGFGYQATQSSDPLDIASNILEQRVQRAQAASTGPVGAFVQLFNPEARQHNLQLIQQGTEQLQKIREQKATIAANQQEAATLGLAPGEVPDVATREQRVDFAKNRALKGDLRVYQGLAAVDPKAAESIADQVYEAGATHLKNAQLAYDRLSMADNAGEYNATLRALRQQGVMGDIEALGFKAPEGPQGFDQFNAAKSREGQALRDARIHMDTIRQKLEDRNTYQPMAKDEAATYSGRLTTAAGDEIKNGVWSRNAAMGTRGFVVNGMDDPRNLGKTFKLGDNEQRKALRDEASTAVPKEELEKYRAENRTYDMATQGAKPGTINSNPNIQQGIAEGLASMLRGGNGGANVGLLKIETNKRGFLQSLADKITTEKGAVINELKGKDVAPYLTQLTQGQIRDVLDALKQYNDRSISDRIAPIAERAGALGFDGSVFGLGKGESGGVIGEAMERGRQAQIDRMMPLHQAIGRGDGVLQLGAQRPGAGATGLGADQGTMNQIPGAPPLRTPAQQAMSPQPTPPAPSGTPAAPAAPSNAQGQPQGSTPPGPTPAAPQPSAPGGGGTAPSAPGPAPAAPGPAGGPPQPFGAGATPFQPSPDPVTHAMNGIATAVHQFAAANGGTPQQAQAEVQKIATNPRVEKELTETGQVQGKTVAAALGAGGNKTLVRHLTDFLNKWFTAGASPDNTDPLTGQHAMTPGEVGQVATEHLPTIGSTLGGVVGGALGNVPGGMAGGAAGGAGGQALKDYILGNQQDPTKIAEEGGLGAVLGVVPEGRPVLGALARTVGAAGVEGGAAAARGGDAGDVADAAMSGAGGAVAGEAFGRALGMAGHKVWKMFTPDAKKSLQDAAETLATARKTLETEEPKIAGATGAVDNPKYQAAEVAVQKAEATIKDAGLTPEEVEYAHKVTSEGVPKNEAAVNKPGALEEQRIGQGYTQLRDEIGAAGKGELKPTPKLADGPVAAVESGAVSQKHAELAQRTEAVVTAPAKNWQEKWTQLQKARSALLTAERDAQGSTAPGKTQIANDMRTLADTVRKQQEKAAAYVFGPEKGKAFIQRLQVLDTRYRNLMEATNGGDVMAAAKMKGEAGRAADRAYRAFAHDDQAALAAWNALRGAKSDVEKDVRTLVGAEKIPVLGHAISAAKLAAGFKEYLAERAAGAPVKFMDVLRRDGEKLNIGGQAAAVSQRAILQ